MTPAQETTSSCPRFLSLCVTILAGIATRRGDVSPVVASVVLTFFPGSSPYSLSCLLPCVSPPFVLCVHHYKVTDGMIMAASEALAGANRAEDLAEGRIYPGLSDVRSISVRCVEFVVLE